MAAKWFERAAKRGVVQAQFNDAILYEQGVGVPRDSTIAVQWLRQAAEQGFAHAVAMLGDVYYYGRGVHRNVAEATRWYLLPS